MYLTFTAEHQTFGYIVVSCSSETIYQLSKAFYIERGFTIRYFATQF